MATESISSIPFGSFNRFRKLSAVLALSITALTLAACGPMSDSTKEQGKTAICAAGGGLVAQIKTGGAVTKFVASVVKDNSTGDIQVLATKIANGDSDAKAAQELGDYVDGLCNK
jgi:hypothetical protein